MAVSLSAPAPTFNIGVNRRIVKALAFSFCILRILPGPGWLNGSGQRAGEERRQTLGKVGRVYFAVYMEREEETRLISGRLANKAERRSYNGYDYENNKGWTKAD